MVLVTAALAVGGGGVLVGFGWRGRRSGSEPRCRRCGYDLRGAPGRACPECSEPWHTHRIGMRQRQRWLLGTGALLIIGGLTAAARPVAAWYQRFDVYTLAPNWLLERSVEEKLNLRAAAVLCERWYRAELSDDRALRLLRMLLPAEVHTRDHRPSDRMVPVLVRTRNIPGERVRAGWPSPSRGFQLLTLTTKCEILNQNRLTGESGYHHAELLASSSYKRGMVDAPLSEPADFVVQGRVSFTVQRRGAQRGLTWSVPLHATSRLVDESPSLPGLVVVSGSKPDTSVASNLKSILDNQSPQGEQPGFWVVGYADLYRDDEFLGRTFVRCNLVSGAASQFGAPAFHHDKVVNWRARLVAPGPAKLVLTSRLDEAWWDPLVERAWEGVLHFEVDIAPMGLQVLQQAAPE